MLYGGKFCAALDRQHPRDLFDVAQFFGGGGTVDDVKGGFIALALGPDADVFGIPGLEKLPAIIWKRRNLETLRRKDARKFTDNAMALERMLL